MRSKFDAATRQAIIDILEGGSTILTAARAVGVHRATLHRWLARGENARLGTTFREFFDAVQAAEAHAEIRAANLIQQGMRDDPKWAAWYLERRRPRSGAAGSTSWNPSPARSSSSWRGMG